MTKISDLLIMFLIIYFVLCLIRHLCKNRLIEGHDSSGGASSVWGYGDEISTCCERPKGNLKEPCRHDDQCGGKGTCKPKGHWYSWIGIGEGTCVGAEHCDVVLEKDPTLCEKNQ